jgi:hypothetical protein
MINLDATKLGSKKSLIFARAVIRNTGGISVQCIKKKENPIVSRQNIQI